jgi:hypothetical protein
MYLSYYGGTANPANPAYLPYLPATTTTYLSKSITHINHYHFLEIPILAFIVPNPGSKTPFSIEAGITPSQLLSSDALVFHYNTGLYYKDNSAINKTQLSGTLGFLVGFWSHHTLVRVGPEMQYHFTILVSESTGGYVLLFF